MHTNPHSNVDKAASSVVQRSRQPLDKPIVECTEQQDAAPDIQMTQLSIEEEHKVPSENEINKQFECTELTSTSGIMLDNSVFLSNAGVTTLSHQISQASPEEQHADYSPELPQIKPLFIQQILLMNVALECPQTHAFNTCLTLVVMQDGDICQSLHLSKTSSTCWKTDCNIALPTFKHADIMLCIQSSYGNDEAFCTITSDEIYATMIAGNGALVEHMFTSLNEDDSIMIKMVSTVTSGWITKVTEIIQIYQEIEATKLCFQQKENLDNISQIVLLYEKLVFKYSAQLHSSEYAFLFDWSNKLGNAYLARFKHTRNVQDIEHAISHLQKAIEIAPSDHPDLVSYCHNLGLAYIDCFKATGNIQNIECAISHLNNAVRSISPDHSSFALLSDTLGKLYAFHFGSTNNIHDIDLAILHLQNAIQSTPSGHSTRFSRWGYLGNAYIRRFEHTGNIQDIEHAISNFKNAVQSTPLGHCDLSIWCSRLGNAYMELFNHTDNKQDIENAISHFKNAVQSAPPYHSDFPSWCANLGNAYRCQYEHTSNIQDIDFAILHLQNAIQSTPSGHSALFSNWSNLGTAYIYRFEHTGNIQDIEHGIFHLQNSVQSTPSGHSTLSSRRSSLAIAYIRRFERTANIYDIENAISHLQNVVQSTPPGDSRLSLRCGNLGNAYIRQYIRTGNIQDIEHAISHLQTAIQPTSSSHSDLSLWSSSLGIAYANRFEYTGNTQDIEHAISYLNNSLQSTPSDNPDFPAYSSNLGNAYTHLFERTRNIEDIEHAISHLQNAIKSTPPEHSDLSALYHNLATAFRSRYLHLHDDFDIKHTISSLANAAAANGAPSTRLRCAQSAAILCLEHKTSNDDTQCLNSFSIAIGLLAEVAGLEQTIHRRYSNLNAYSGLVSNAVTAAFILDRADLALEWLEQGRCLVWNQLGQLRAPIGKLMIKDKKLANRFIEVATDLESYGSRSIIPLPVSHDKLSKEIDHQRSNLNHTMRATEYKQLLNEIRHIPDFHDFLKPPQSGSILSIIPSTGPIVILNAFETRCDALALISGAEYSLHIPLKNFSLEDASRLHTTLQSDILHYREVEDGERLCGRRRNRKSMSDILEELWRKVVHPILEALAFSVPPMSSNRPRLWWCPTGPFAFLPLHAAGIYGSAYKTGSCVSDFVISSYTPTVRSISEKFAASVTSTSGHTNLLIVSQPHTPGLSPIPSTTTETHAIQDMMKGERHVNALLLENAEATIDKVKCEMDSHSWIHFACHGIQDRADALQSGVCLHDGRLELLEIMHQKSPSPEFAFLSACQTSTGDVRLSDEVVHLAAGMLASGYRGVVGTMWSISDYYGPDFAKLFYQYLLNNIGTGGLDSTLAAYALDDATRKVREKLKDDETSFLTWVPYVHFGY